LEVLTDAGEIGEVDRAEEGLGRRPFRTGFGGAAQVGEGAGAVQAEGEVVADAPAGFQRACVERRRVVPAV
jgi:hypothetical protein